MKKSRKNFFSSNWAVSLTVIMAVALVMSSCSADSAELDEHKEFEAAHLKAENVTVESQLKKVRQIAQRFHSFKQAEKAGYAEPFPFNPSPYVPNMGYHYINVGLMDGNFELEKPEILLYVPNRQGKLKLVGVEYAIPAAPGSTPPEGFVGDEDHWHYNPNVAGGSWTLHAWVVLDNPDGVFASFNPNVPATNPSQN